MEDEDSAIISFVYDKKCRIVAGFYHPDHRRLKYMHLEVKQHKSRVKRAYVCMITWKAKLSQMSCVTMA